MHDELRAGQKDRFSLSADLDQTTGKLHWLQIVNRERSNFVPFLNKMAVLMDMDESESVAQPTPGTSSGADSETIPPVLTEQDIPGAALNEPMDQYTMPELRWWLLCHGIQVTASLREKTGGSVSTGGIVALSVPLLVPGVG